MPETLLCLEKPLISKYQKWYEWLIDAARTRPRPIEYTELHHVCPKSCGGSDDPANLVRLTYREHFIAHWLLTKFYTGGDLRRMRWAMKAMTLTLDGKRIIAGWQFDVAKRAIYTAEMMAERARRERADHIRATHRIVVEKRQERLRATQAEMKECGWKLFADEGRFASDVRFKLPPIQKQIELPPALVANKVQELHERRRVRRRRTRPGKRGRMAARAAREANLNNVIIAQI